MRRLPVDPAPSPPRCTGPPDPAPRRRGDTPSRPSGRRPPISVRTCTSASLMPSSADSSANSPSTNPRSVDPGVRDVLLHHSVGPVGIEPTTRGLKVLPSHSSDQRFLRKTGFSAAQMPFAVIGWRRPRTALLWAPCGRGVGAEYFRGPSWEGARSLRGGGWLSGIRGQPRPARCPHSRRCTGRGVRRPRPRFSSASTTTRKPVRPGGVSAGRS